MTPQVTIYTDGACKGNPGPGGWGAILMSGTHRKELHGGEPVTTNNRMELTAAIMALEALTKPCAVELHTDSQYMRQGITEWIHGWKARGWRTASKAPVKNEDLWRRLDAARARHDVQWRWVKGHAGHPLNERADELANLGCREARPTKVERTVGSAVAGPDRTLDARKLDNRTPGSRKKARLVKVRAARRAATAKPPEGSGP